MAYCSASNVAIMCKSILGSEPAFSTATCPSLTSVEYWMSSGCAVINSTLVASRFPLPISVAAPLYDWLSELNALYAAAKVEMSRTTATVQARERTRGQVFEGMFWDGLNKIVGLGSQAIDDLTSTGGTGYSHTPIYAGGIYDSDKDVYDEDTDRITPRFRRGQFMGQFDTTAS